MIEGKWKLNSHFTRRVKANEQYIYLIIVYTQFINYFRFASFFWEKIFLFKNHLDRFNWSKRLIWNKWNKKIDKIVCADAVQAQNKQKTEEKNLFRCEDKCIRARMLLILRNRNTNYTTSWSVSFNLSTFSFEREILSSGIDPLKWNYGFIISNRKTYIYVIV